ncbi:MAG: hypothetical protein WC607_01660 [Candidatus Micrarchaeia archaeon]
MRFFKHGEVLAIALPESLRARHGVREGDDYEFVEVAQGVFALARKTPGEPARPALAESKPAAGAPARIVKPAEKIKASPEAMAFARAGYAVLNSEGEAKQLSDELEQFIKNGQVVGVRGFDKRFYVVSREFLERHSSAVLGALKEPNTARVAAAQAKMAFDAFNAALVVLKEQGEIIEKKKGVFQTV